jgi:hypothetical protein
MKKSNVNYMVKTSRRPNELQRFLWNCSGADSELLAQCPTEWSKYAGIGAVVMFTAFLAAFSGGYAFYAIFRMSDQAVFYALFFGLIWGLIIFNLDRFIVATIRKQGDTGMEIKQVAPRILLAIFLSIVISKPLELRIFENRIAQQILEDKWDKIAHEKQQIEQMSGKVDWEKQLQENTQDIALLQELQYRDPDNPTFQSLKAKVEKAHAALTAQEAKSKATVAAMVEEQARLSRLPENQRLELNEHGERKISGLTHKANHDINELSQKIALLTEEVDQKKASYNQLLLELRKQQDAHRAMVTNRIKERQDEMDRARRYKSMADSTVVVQMSESSAIKDQSYSNTFITQLEAMGNLTKKNSIMAMASWMIMLLFIMIETTPVMVKLMGKRGPYDELLDRVEYVQMIKQQEVISRWNTRIGSLVARAQEAAKLEGEIFIQVERQRLEHELKTNQLILDDLAEKQAHLARLSVDKWYREALEAAERDGDSEVIHEDALMT